MIKKILLLVEKFLENIVIKKNLSKNTVLSYKNDIVQFVNYINLKELSNLDEKVLLKKLGKSKIAFVLAILFGISLFFFRGSSNYSNLFNSDDNYAYITSSKVN